MPTRPPTHNPHGSRSTRERQRKRLHDRHRGSSTARGYDRRWRKARQVYLGEHPLCVACLAQGHTRPATVVDHVEPHRGDPVKFWDQDNWQALCEPHHNAKTAREGTIRGGGPQNLDRPAP